MGYQTLTVYHGGNESVPHDFMFFTEDIDFAKDYGTLFTYQLKFDKTRWFDSSCAEHVSKVLPLFDPYSSKEINTFDEYLEVTGSASDTWEAVEDSIRSISSSGWQGAIIFEGGIKNYLVFEKSLVHLIDPVKKSAISEGISRTIR